MTRCSTLCLRRRISRCGTLALAASVGGAPIGAIMRKEPEDPHTELEQHQESALVGNAAMFSLSTANVTANLVSFNSLVFPAAKKT